jgi:hypothetical protein
MEMEGSPGSMGESGFWGISKKENVFHFFLVWGTEQGVSAERRILINMNVAGPARNWPTSCNYAKCGT